MVAEKMAKKIRDLLFLPHPVYSRLQNVSDGVGGLLPSAKV